jgi:hypothetical protein
MLEYEWRELEALCERLADLRHRQSFATRSKNVGLMEGLQQDIARVTRQRELLVKHISARLGSVSAEQAGSGDGKTDPAAADDGTEPSATKTAGGNSGPSGEKVGFLS